MVSWNFHFPYSEASYLSGFLLVSGFWLFWLFWLPQTWPSPWGHRKRCFPVALCCRIVRRSNLEAATKRLLHQQVKNRDSFSAMSRIEVCPYSYFRWCGYFRGPWVSFVTTDEFSVRVTKITWKIGVSWTHSLPFLFLTYF